MLSKFDYILYDKFGFIFCIIFDQRFDQSEAIDLYNTLLRIYLKKKTFKIWTRIHVVLIKILYNSLNFGCHLFTTWCKRQQLILFIFPYNKYYYIHNWPLQSFSQDYGLTLHTTHLVCINFIHEWRDLQSNVDSERQIVQKLFLWQVYLVSEFLSEICWQVIGEEIFFFIFRLSVWPHPCFTPNKPTRCPLD